MFYFCLPKFYGIENAVGIFLIELRYHALRMFDAFKSLYTILQEGITYMLVLQFYYIVRD